MDCRVTRLRDRMAPAMEVNANHNILAELIGNTPLVKLNHIPQTAGVKATIAASGVAVGLLSRIYTVRILDARRLCRILVLYAYIVYNLIIQKNNISQLTFSGQ